MNNKGRIEIIIAIFSFSILIIILGVLLFGKMKPNNDFMSIDEYYNVKDDEVLIVLHDRIYDKKALLIDGTVYIDYETVYELFNKKMYWDENENILTYTTPNEIIQAEVGKSGYMVSKNMIKSKVDLEYDVIKLFANNVYVAINFIDSYSDIKYSFYQEPNRIVIDYIWEEFLYTDIVKGADLRTEASIKSPILVKIEAGTTVQLVNLSEVPEKGFTQVITKDGIVGFIKNKYIKQTYYKKLESDFKEQEYSSLSRTSKINLVFHQVFNTDASNNLENLISETKGVTTVSPTWFSIIDNEGNLSSLADEKYIKKANQLGLEVWALVDDFDKDISMYEILSHTSTRENLANNLIEMAIKYKLNGINIDFEKITKDSGIHYLQFMRELSVKCRNNGIILSSDTYVPSSYTEHYYREEQGEVIDYVIVMAYDEHYGGSEQAGPVASIGFVKDAVSNILKVVPKEKVIIALPFYTRVWKEEDGDLSSESHSMTPIINLFKENDVEPEWDSETGHFYGEFTKDGANYKIWQEEDKSMEEKLQAVNNGDVAGIGFWKLGLERESIWNIVLKYIN